MRCTDPSVRCDARITFTKRCACFIGRKHGTIHDKHGYPTAVLCENHKKVLRRGKTVALADRRILYIDESGVNASR